MTVSVTIADLPTELLVKIILHLDWTSVLRLQQVNKTFDGIVREHVAVRYHLELGIAGLVDAPHLNSRDAHVVATATTTATTDERLRRLKTYNARWRNLDFSPSSSSSPQVARVPKLAGSTVWELAGGVLGQGVATNVNEHIGRAGVRKMMFTRFPGGVRMLETSSREQGGVGDAREGEKRGEEGEWMWTHEGYEFPIRDFTMDPSQDLLVLLRESTGSVGISIGIAPGLSLGLGLGTPTSTGPADADADAHPHSQNIAEIHLRSLSTNEPHPLAAKYAVFVHALHGGTRGRSHSMQVCHDRLAVLHEARAGHFPEKLVVYAWKEGEMLFDISFCGIMSFAFLTPNHLLFAVQPFNVLPACQGDHQPRLLVCDIERTKALSASASNSSPVDPTSEVASTSEGRQRGLGLGLGGRAVGKTRGRRPVEAYVALAEFHLPELKQYADVTDITIRVDPPPPPLPPYSSHPPSSSSSSSYDANRHSDGIDSHAEINVTEAAPVAGGPVPAFVPAPESRLFVVTLHVETVLEDTGDHRASEHVAVGIFVPLQTFLAFLPSRGKEWEWDGREEEIIPSNSDDEALYFGDFYARPARRIAVPWREWMQPSPTPSPAPSYSQSAFGYLGHPGHRGARVLLLPGAIGDTIWVCNVSGTRCVYALEPRDVVVPLAPRRVAVYEFGEGLVRREVCAAWEREEEEDGLTSTSTSTSTSSLVSESRPAPEEDDDDDESGGTQTLTRPQNGSEGGGGGDVTTARNSSSSSLSSSHSRSSSRSSSSSSSASHSSTSPQNHRPHVETVLTPSTIPASSSSSSSSSSSTSAVTSVTSTPDVSSILGSILGNNNNNNNNNGNGGIGVFDEDVTTSLPYRRTVLREKKRFDGVMMTEDSLVFISHRAPREFEVWTV